MTTLPDLLVDLDAEYGVLRGVVDGLTDDDARWDRATPAPGWAVRDQISHLAYFDDAGRMAMVEPEDFARSIEEVLASAGDPMDVHLVKGRSIGGDELLAWWDGAHRAMVEAFADADPAARVPWYGPPMGVLSFISARLMETWAHGQDVCDALGVGRVPTARLRHIAHLCGRARSPTWCGGGMCHPVESTWWSPGPGATSGGGRSATEVTEAMSPRSAARRSTSASS
jgi:uncharacterized protein (TIGR03084 family)